LKTYLIGGITQSTSIPSYSTPAATSNLKILL